jgi:flagellar hook-length control protein FliK
MIRRLHEIEPPKLGLPSDKSNKSEDPTAKESLASEFKKLLDRARSGLSGARDEVTALGFALAQAVSSVQEQKTQVQGPEKTEGPKAGENYGDASDGESVDCSAQHQTVVVRDSGQKKETGPVNQGPVEEEGEGDTNLDSLGDEAIDLDQGGEEIALEEEIVYTDLDELDVDADFVSLRQDQSAQVTSQHLMVAENQTEVAETTEVEVDQELASGLQRVVLSGEEEVEDETWSDDMVSDHLAAQTGTSELARPQFSAKRSNAKADDHYATGNEDIDRLVSQMETEQSPDILSTGGEFQSRTPVGESRIGSEVEKSVFGARREVSTWSDMSLMAGVSPSKEKNGELSMQLSLLRQAYDSLKAQTSSMVDSRSKSPSAGVSGVGATAEPRATQNEGAPRAARYLNRATSQKMMERIETALREAARSRDGKTITLRLDPMQLGQVKCDVSLRDGLLHARITPQNPDVVNAVREHAHELQTALRRLGLNVDRVSVQVLSEKEPGNFAQSQGFPDGKSFQQDGNNMPGRERQTPENTLGNEFADVSGSVALDAGITPADHWIA